MWAFMDDSVLLGLGIDRKGGEGRKEKEGGELRVIEQDAPAAKERRSRRKIFTSLRCQQ